ncbi:ribonuclease P protein component [Synechococcus sp. BIOS-E4-1]|uniref:ribonuclease P protein component n=1 Tax=Synechococcus sp. BIOS-E4-1 TaxID=1400864 RepID=UPI0016482304|nr:ribonuclease P protein component [Synechococcus sp. BIOS-E4-1]QNI55883.1 ribonuclease P protein component [Synechococcus sp. BIOS-E4-1]
MVLPASMRLRGHRCFDHLHRKGKRFHGNLMVLRKVSAHHSLLKRRATTATSHLPRGTPTCRVAVVISSKVSKRAVIRNRLRRRLHDHLRIRFEHAPEHASVWILVSLKPGAATEDHDLLEECDRLLEQAGLKP